MSVTPDERCDLKAGQHSDENRPFEVFWQDEGSDLVPEEIAKAEGYWHAAGWYWWPYSPGRLPDGDALGPFNTSTEAWQDAKAGDYDLPEYTEPAKYGNT